MHWLIKSEPFKYSFDDLLRDGETVWDGVRNNQAAIYLRSMKIGEELAFYHSNEGLAVVGVARVSGEHFIDPSDPKGAVSGRESRAGAPAGKAGDAGGDEGRSAAGGDGDVPAVPAVGGAADGCRMGCDHGAGRRMTLAGPEPLHDNPDAGADWARRLGRHGAAPALLTADGAVVSYAELAARADAWAARLGPGRRFVALLVRNDVASIIAYVGAMRAGHPVLLLDADGSAERILADFAPDVVACPSDDRLEVGAATTELHPDLALLLSTSGSTGSPKLVRLSGEAVAANGRAIVQYLGLTAAERAVTTLAIHYSFGLSVLNSHLMAGAALIVTDLSVTHPDFAALLERMQPTSLSGVPYIYELLERTGLEERLPASITSLTQAGGRLPADKVRALAERGTRQGFRFFAMYGQTEAAPRMAYLPPELAARFPDCIGRAIPGGAFTLEDADGNAITAPETPGELVYRGPNVMMGYATAPADLARGAELEALRTGDIAVRNEAGLYRITGRASRFAKIAGLRIGFDDVEALLAAAGQTAVVTGDDALVAVHVEAADTPEARQAVAELVAERAHIPESAIAVVSGPVPRLATGKTDYGAIRRAAAAAAEARLAATAGAHPILAGYARAFGRPNVTPADSFQSLGGDSLAYVNAAMSLEKALGRLPARWEEMPVSALMALAPASGDGGGQSRIATETLLRLLALTLVILGHAAAGRYRAAARRRDHFVHDGGV